MRPYSDIKIGDVYQRYDGAMEWVVYKKCDEEKMVQLLPMVDGESGLYVGSIWKRNTDSIFNRRVMEGRG